VDPLSLLQIQGTRTQDRIIFFSLSWDNNCLWLPFQCWESSVILYSHWEGQAAKFFCIEITGKYERLLSRWIRETWFVLNYWP